MQKEYSTYSYAFSICRRNATTYSFPYAAYYCTVFTINLEEELYPYKKCSSLYIKIRYGKIQLGKHTHTHYTCFSINGEWSALILVSRLVKVVEHDSNAVERLCQKEKHVYDVYDTGTYYTDVLYNVFSCFKMYTSYFN